MDPDGYCTCCGKFPQLEGKRPRGLGDLRAWCQAWTMIKWSDPKWDGLTVYHSND